MFFCLLLHLHIGGSYTGDLGNSIFGTFFSTYKIGERIGKDQKAFVHMVRGGLFQIDS